HKDVVCGAVWYLIFRENITSSSRSGSIYFGRVGVLYVCWRILSRKFLLHPNAMDSSSSRMISVIVSPKNQIPKSTINDHQFDQHFQQQDQVHSTTLNLNLNSLSNHDSSKCSTTLTTGHHGQHQPAANRMSYPREFKLLVINYYYQNGQNKYRTCKEFQITKSMLNGWLTKVEKIRSSRPGSLKSGRSGRKPQFPSVEKQLFQVYQNCLDQGKKVGNRWLRDTAKTIAQEQCSPDELNGMCQFSERWLCNFKKRYNINLTKDWTADSSSSGGGACTTKVRVTETTTTSSPSLESPVPVSLTATQMDDEDQPIDLSKMGRNRRASEQFVDHRVLAAGSNNAAFVCSVGNAVIESDGGMAIGANYEPGRRGRKVQFPRVEKILYDHLLEKQAHGDRISNRWLQDEARRLAVELCPEMFTDAFKSARCMFSEHWLHNFKKRYNVTLKSFADETAMTLTTLASNNDHCDLLDLTIKNHQTLVRPIPINPVNNTILYNNMENEHHEKELTILQPLVIGQHFTTIDQYYRLNQSPNVLCI
uniref:HTH CENPB-type domain-containing protein n=1 Tax=Romanomermis culicivorax TaxID=13658 RepID=A0A915JHM0_ROMCU